MTIRTIAFVVVAATAWAAWPGRLLAQAPPPVPPRIAIADEPAGAAVELIESAGPLPFAVAVRLQTSAADTPEVIGARLAAMESRGLPVWLALPAPALPGEVDAWREKLRGLLARPTNAIVLIEIEADDQPPAVVRFAVQTAFTEAGAAGRAIRIALGGVAMTIPSRRAEIFTTALAPYVEVLAIPGGMAESTQAWMRQAGVQADIAVVAARETPPAGLEFHRATLAQLGSAVTIRAWRIGDVSPAALRALALAGPLLSHRVVTLADADVSLTTGGPSSGRSHVLLFDTDTLGTYLAYWGPPADEPMTADLSLRFDGAARLLDLSRSREVPAADFSVKRDGTRVVLRLPQTGGVMLLDFNDGARPFAEASEVSAARVLSVGEIIARHQRQQRAQDALVDHYVSRVRMEQHFRPTVADPGYDVVTDNTYYAGRDGVEWVEHSFAVNGSKWTSNRPPFPLLQPEKVLELPLLLRFDEGYTYRLVGTDRVNGFDCYVVRFDPVRDDNALYRGTVYIDRRTFARVRVQAVRSQLPPPIISNDETHDYLPVATIGGQPVFLFTHLNARQIMLVAGRNLLVEKRVFFSDFAINDPGFAEKRAAARESDAVMFRETPDGLRYYVKEGGRRVVRDRPTRDLKALAMGVTLDPSYAFPLPMFGINYLNFHFRNPDTQLAILFAGVLAAGNIQRSNFGAKSLDASVDFFAIAAPSTDRVYGPDGDDPEVRVLTWPLSTGVNLGWQATPFQKATLQYQFRFDGYVADRQTSPEFVVPSSTVTNGLGGAWEYRRRGYSVVTNAAWYWRAAWKPWGDGQITPAHFAKYTVTLSRDFFIDAFQKLHFNGSWFGSSHLDRFGRYQFGMFDDTRLHGVPSSGVRFGEVAMARGAYSVNIFEQYRVDLFLEHAWGREDAGRGDWERIPALGLALNVRGPWNTILRVDAGKSWLPDRYDRLGSATLQIMMLKPLR